MAGAEFELRAGSLRLIRDIIFDAAIMKDGVHRSQLMIRPVSVKALPNYCIDIRFSDGSAGVVDLSDLAGKGVFAAWKDPKVFAAVHLGAHRQIQWSEEIELDPDAMYMRLTGKTPEDLFPALKSENSHA